jgi:putative Flp pilus-assembly TadE/G-like protein
MDKAKRHSSPRKQTGAVAIIVGLSIVVLVAFIGLVVDLGHMFVIKTELADAADACALAAAKELDGTPAALARAESAGTTAGQRNKVDFQSQNVVVTPNLDVTFSDHLNGTYYSKDAVAPTNMKYAKCTLPLGGILPYFMQVMGFGAQTVASHAVASLRPGITNCGLPMAMCQQKTPPATCPDGVSTPDSLGFCKGQWYCSRFTNGNNGGACPGGASSGNFNLIDYTPPNGGASELADILAGAGQCNLNVGHPVGQTGMQQSITDAWNTRFGLYKGSYNVNNATPDFTGYAYTPTTWPTMYNALSGGVGINLTSARTSNLTYQGDAATGINNTNGSSSATSSQLNAGADRRLAVLPVVDCDCWGSSPPASCNVPTPPPPNQINILKFACILMLHPMGNPGEDTYIEYEGLSDDASNPCATLGLPGGPGAVGPKVPSLVR